MIRYYLSPPVHADVELRFERKTSGASGFDLMANIGVPRELGPHERLVIRTGLYLAMPLGIEGQVRCRSGLARDHGVATVPGTIDSDYRGEISVVLINHSSGPVGPVLPGDRVAQLVFAPVVIPGPLEMAAPAFNPTRLIVARNTCGMTQTELAAASGTSQSAISKAEAGKVVPTDSSVASWARALDFPVCYFSESDGRRPEGLTRFLGGIPLFVGGTSLVCVDSLEELGETERGGGGFGHTGR